MINRSPLCMVFTSDLHYCTAVLKWPTRLVSASTSFIKICLQIKFIVIYEFAFSAVHFNVTLPNFLPCSPADCRAEIFQDENKLKVVAKAYYYQRLENNRLVHMASLLLPSCHGVLSFSVTESSLHTLYFLNPGLINSFTQTHIYTNLQFFFWFH